MKVWNFKVKSNSQEITKKLNSAFGSVNGFVLDVENDNNSVRFKVRKRILYAFQTLLRNHIIAKGKITHTENETEVKISFSQHFLNTLEVSIFLILGLVSIIFGLISSNVTASILGGIFLGFGILFLIFTRSQYTRNVQEYKTLFTEILDL
jgi:hypothetical protein